MCAALASKWQIFRPGKKVALWRGGNAVQLVWAGFARQESLGWWKRKGGELVDVPAARFAERSDRDRRLIWDDMPAGQVVRGIVDAGVREPIVKIVTRASTEEELRRYEHDRMPLIKPPLFNAEPFLVAEEPGDLPPQLDLFSPGSSAFTLPPR